MSAIAISRLIGPVPLDVIIREKHESELEITENAVERGAKITDHAYTRPKTLVLDVADGAAAATWQALKQLQASRIPFSLVTGLDVYQSMLIKRLSAERDAEFSRVLRGTVELQEIIIASSAYTTVAGSEARPTSGGEGNPGGAKSRRHSQLTSSAAAPGAAADRAAGVTNRGDSVSSTVPASRGSSILARVL